MKFLYLIPLFPLLGFLFNFTSGVRVLTKRGGHGHDARARARRGAPRPVADHRPRRLRLGALSFLVAVCGRASGPRARPTTRRGDPLDLDPRGPRRDRGPRHAGASAFSIDWAYLVDPLSSVMLLVVTFVGFLIHVYSIGYMSHDPGYARYMSYLNLFMFAMLTLVLGANYAVLFVGWEGVGLCSLPAHRVLVREAERVGRGQEGLHRQPHRRRGLPARDVPDLPHLRQPRLPDGDGGGRPPARRARLDGHPHPDRPLPVHRGHRQERAAPALRLAARRHGRARPRSPPSSMPPPW